jgi:hypothetical protein
MKRYAEYLEEELRKLKGPNWRPSMPRPNFVRRSSVCVVMHRRVVAHSLVCASQMSVSISSMENKLLNESAAQAGGSGGAQAANGRSGDASGGSGGGGAAAEYSSEDEDDQPVDENGGVLDALDIAQLKVELETAREEGQMRIDELARELKEVRRTRTHALMHAR